MLPVLAKSGLPPAITNEFGAFTLGMDDRSPEELVGLMRSLGYNGLMASTWGRNPIGRLQAYTNIPAVQRGEFRIYSILWTPKPADLVDTNWLKQVLGYAVQLRASLWVAYTGTTNDLPRVEKNLAVVADECSKVGVDLVLYPHYGHPYDTVEHTLPVLQRLHRSNVKLSIHLCHEMKAGNERRFDEIIAAAAPYLVLASINGSDDGEIVRRNPPDDWSHAIRPLDEGSYDITGYLRALRRHGYRGPILLHTFGIKAAPDDHLARSMHRWKEIEDQLNQVPVN